MASSLQPKGQPAARPVAIILSLLLLVVIFVVARELWSMRTGSQLESWLDPVFDTFGRAHYQAWMFPAGLAGASLGVLLIIVSLLPRRRTHRAITSTSSIWVRPVDVARMCTAAAEKIPGVMRASTFATPRSVTVSLSGDILDESLIPRVESALTPLLADLQDNPTLTIRVQQRNESNA